MIKIEGMECVSCHELCEWLGINDSVLSVRWYKKGFPSITYGSHTYFPIKEVRKWFKVYKHYDPGYPKTTLRVCHN